MIYGPVDQPMELVSRDELSEESGCLLCESLQVTQHSQAGTVPQHIEMLARGNSRIEGKTFWGESDTITYDGSKSQYVLIGDSAGLARLWRQLKIVRDSQHERGLQDLFQSDHAHGEGRLRPERRHRSVVRLTVAGQLGGAAYCSSRLTCCPSERPPKARQIERSIALPIVCPDPSMNSTFTLIGW